MLIRIVSQYLVSHKRLVIPQLGTFIVKEPGVSVVFSELLKRDDGVLRGLLTAQGAGDLEAAGEIDRFVFEVRHAIEHGEEVLLGGLGLLRPGSNGTIAFVYDPTVADPQWIAAHEKHAGQLTELQPEAADQQSTQTAEEFTNPVKPQTAALKESSVAAAERIDHPHIINEQAAHSRVSPSVKFNPEPCLRGLRYGKPHKNTNAYTFVGNTPRRRMDRFLLFAILAAVIAVAAIAFGYFQQSREKELLMELAPVEQPVESQPAPDQQ